MNTNEANKTIAEYMGHDVLECYDPNFGFYHQSLDALIPVWERCGFFRSDEFPCFFKNGKNFYVELMVNENMSLPWVSGEGETIQEAAAIATAQAIIEINKPKQEIN